MLAMLPIITWLPTTEEEHREHCGFLYSQLCCRTNRFPWDPKEWPSPYDIRHNPDAAKAQFDVWYDRTYRAEPIKKRQPTQKETTPRFHWDEADNFIDEWCVDHGTPLPRKGKGNAADLKREIRKLFPERCPGKTMISEHITAALKKLEDDPSLKLEIAKRLDKKAGL
jgi:hypothetical protein